MDGVSNIANPLVQTQLLGEALDKASVAVVVNDDDHRYVAANAYASELLGYTREELLAMRVGDLSLSRGRAERAYRRAQAEPGETTGQNTLIAKDGRRVPIRWWASRTRIGGVEYFLVLMWPR